MWCLNCFLHATLWQETPDASRFTNTRTRKKFGDIYMKWCGWTPGNVSLVNIRTEVTGIEMNFVATQSQDERFTVLRTHWLATIFLNFYYIIARTAQNLQLSYWSFTTTPRGRLSFSPFYMLGNWGPEKLSYFLKAIGQQVEEMILNPDMSHSKLFS